MITRQNVKEKGKKKAKDEVLGCQKRGEEFALRLRRGLRSRRKIEKRQDFPVKPRKG